ncbi:imidazole glycerol phosphate synthase subunit HisH [Fibrobacterota bacterium]
MNLSDSSDSHGYFDENDSELSGQKIIIIDYGLGNVRSVSGAVEKLGFHPTLSSKVDDLETADKLILPGVGAFQDGMENLVRLGVVDVLNHLVMEERKPILGICLGAQLLARESFEFGRHDGLGWIDASVVKLNVENYGLKIPHVGWNDLFQTKKSILFDGIIPGALFYYVHSFHIQCSDDKHVVGECEYGRRFASVIQKSNIYATQFHPEKSQFYGMMLLKNFLTKA